MARFEYLEAHTVREAMSLYRQHSPDVRYVAGSTDFLIRSRMGNWDPEYVVNIQHIPALERVSFSRRNGLRLGALVTVQTLEDHDAVRIHYPALAAAAAAFAGVQVRNLATVGGNICNASPAGDTLPALLAFNAQCLSSGPRQGDKRSTPLDQFFTGPGRTALAPGELLTEIRLPPPGPNTGSLYIKHSPRGAMDIATVGVASVVTLDAGGMVCREVRIGLGAVAPTPVRAYAAEDILRGKEITPELLAACAEEARNISTPIDDVRGSAAYRKEIVGVLTRRTLERAVEMARAGAMPFEMQRRLAVQAAFY